MKEEPNKDLVVILCMMLLAVFVAGLFIGLVLLSGFIAKHFGLVAGLLTIVIPMAAVTVWMIYQNYRR